MAKALKPEQVEQIHLLRDEVDGWGDPVHSAEWIGQQIGVSESTVWRVLKGRSAYAKGVKGRRLETASIGLMERDGLNVLGQAHPELDAAAELSARKMLATVERQAAAKDLVTPETIARAKAYGAFDGDEL